MENSGEDTIPPGMTMTPGGTATASSGHTQLSGQSLPRITVTPSGPEGTLTTTPPSGGITLQMLQGSGGTEHLRKITHLHQSITRTYNSIPKDSSTILPSVDLYIATLALAAYTEHLANHLNNATRDESVAGPSAVLDVPEVTSEGRSRGRYHGSQAGTTTPSHS
jgi:hypothetical protein